MHEYEVYFKEGPAPCFFIHASNHTQALRDALRFCEREGLTLLYVYYRPQRMQIRIALCPEGQEPVIL